MPAASSNTITATTYAATPPSLTLSLSRTATDGTVPEPQTNLDSTTTPETNTEAQQSQVQSRYLTASTIQQLAQEHDTAPADEPATLETTDEPRSESTESFDPSTTTAETFVEKKRDILITINLGSNPEGTEFKVTCDGQELQRDGSLGTAEYWSTDLDRTYDGLTEGTTHSCTTTARNSDLVETSTSDPASITVGDFQIPFCTLSASPTEPVAKDDPVALTMETFGIISDANISNIPVQTTGGTVTVNPETETLYLGTVIGPGGTYNCSIVVDVDLTLGETVEEIIGGIVETITEVIKNVIEVARQVIDAIRQFIDNPIVEEVVENSAPLIVTIAAANVVAGAGLANLGPILLRIWQTFTEPFLLLSGRRRTPWGVVYNSLTKIPVDLAIVRLFDKKTGQILSTRVTDKQGRFGFIIKPGTYLLTITKTGYNFPSKKVTGEKDRAYENLYHGKPIVVKSRSAFLNLNIPVDKVGEERAKVNRIVQLRFIFRKLNTLLSFLGPVLGIVIYLINQSTLTLVLMIIHISMFFVFLAFIRTKKIRPWGRVFDARTNKPINAAIVRIFDAKYDDLLTTQVTDRKGRFGFFVGPSRYLLTSEKEGFKFPTVKVVKGYKGEQVNVDKQQEQVISFDIPMDEGEGIITTDNETPKPIRNGKSTAEDATDQDQKATDQAGAQDQEMSDDFDDDETDAPTPKPKIKPSKSDYESGF